MTSMVAQGMRSPNSFAPKELHKIRDAKKKLNS